MTDNQQTPGAAAQSAAQSSNENRTLVERLRRQNVSPEMCTLLLDQNTSSLHGFCLVEVLERLQGLSDKTSAVIQKNYDELKTMAMENRNEIIKLQGRLNLSEKQMTELRGEVGLLLDRVTKLEAKKPKVQVTDSAPADESHKYTAMSLEQASAQHPQLKPKTSIEAQQTVAPQAMGPYRDVDTSKSDSSESGEEPDYDYDPRRVPPYSGRSRKSTPRRETSQRSHPRRVQPKVEPVLEPKPDVYRPSYPQQGAQGYAQPYYPMANPNQPGGTLPFADVDRPMETQSRSFLHQPTQVLLGPSVPYLQPLTTMLEPFRFVIDYRAYRLMNQREQPYADELGRMHKLTRKVNALFPNLAKFDGTKPMKLLSLLHSLVKAFNSLGICEAVAVRLLAFYLTGEASRFFDQQTSPGYLYSGTPRIFSWPNVIDALLKRYMSDHVLHEAYQQVTSISQAENEDESAYAARLSAAAQNCNHVFNERTLVHHYITGLLPTTRDIVTERVRGLPIHEQSDLSAVRRVALAEGSTYRARHKSYSQTKSKNRHSTMYMGEPSMMSYQPVRPEVDDGNESAAHSLTVATSLDEFLFIPDQGQNTSSSATDSEIDQLMNMPKESIPKLTEEQRKLAYQVIPENTWHYECWGCREKNHSLFQCRHLDEDQRIYFAYKYYLHKLQAQPHLKKFYEDRLRKRREGHKPTRPTYRPQAGQPTSILRRPNSYGKHKGAPVLSLQEPIVKQDNASQSENSEGQ